VTDSNYLKIIEAETFVINKMYNYREKETASCAEEDLSLEKYDFI
jgi:hypothetical protein